MSTRFQWLSLFLSILACATSVATAVIGYIALQHSAATDRKTQQLSEQAIALQQKEYQSQQVLLSLTPRIDLAATDGTLMATYPRDLPSGSRDVPEDKLTGASAIWLIGDLSNTGGRDATIRQWGLGDSRTEWWPADQSRMQCAVGGDESHWQPCASPYVLSPGHEVKFAFTTTMTMLDSVDAAYRAQGLELCVSMEAYGSYCDHTNARVLATSATPPASH